MKDNKVKGIDRNDDTVPDRARFRFSSKWKVPSWGSTKKLNHSSTIENGLNAMFIKVSEQKKPRSVTDTAVNNSLVSLGFAVANTNARDLHQAIKRGSIDVVRSILGLPHYRDKINSLDKENSYTFMHYAAMYNRPDIIACLVGFGADINTKSGKEGIVPLHIAGKYNCSKAAQALLQYNAKIGITCKTKECPLHYCARYGSDQVAEVLLREAEKLNMTGKVVNHPNNESYYPIHYAALYNNKRMVEILIRYGANITKKNISGRLPSHFAAEHKDTEILELLLQHAKIKGQNNYIMISNNVGGTALHVAADVGSIKAAEVCIRYGADIESQTYELMTPLHIAALNGNYEFAEYLIKKGANVNSKDHEGKTAMHHAALSNNAALIESMIENGADIETRDSKEQTPLLSAVLKGCTTAVKQLLTLGANIKAVDADGRHCIHYMADESDTSTMEVLMDNGGKMLIDVPDNNGIEPIRIAALNGTIVPMYYLANCGASLDVTDEEQNTLLHLAAKGNHRDTVKLIIEKTNAKDINIRNAAGQKPIHVAAENGHNRVIKFMIRFGADINSRDMNSFYPLHYAARGGFTAAVQLLIDKNAKVNVLDRSDNTPLHLACSNGHRQVATILLANGADPTAINNQGLNCLDIAIENDQNEIALQIIRSKDWEKALENRAFDGCTPMQKLVEKLPDVASVVMDRCITYTNEIGDFHGEQIAFNFNYLESSPFQQTKYKDTQDGSIVISSILSHNRINLMTHPLIRAYRHYKWNGLLRYIYYGKVFMNLIFLLAVCLPIGLNIREYYDAVHNATGAYGMGSKEIRQFSNGIYMRNIIMFAFVVFNIIINSLRFFSQKKQYISDIMSSALEIGIEIMALLYCIPFNKHTTAIVVQMGAMIVFLSIVNFLFQLKRAYGIGTYLTMFITIMKTIIQASLVIILFLIAFAVAFYMVLRQIPEFSNVGYAMIRVITMMVGDISYAETFQFLYHNNQLQHAGLALTVFVLFVIVINIAFANLLVGLAVGDINEVRQNADISIIQMDLKFIMKVRTCHLPGWVREYIYKPTLVLRNHDKAPLKEKATWRKLTEGLKLRVASADAVEKCATATVFEELKDQRLEIKNILDKFTDFQSDAFHRLYKIEQIVKELKDGTPPKIAV